MVGIKSNIAAMSAQSNINKASNSAAASISRLSSGNRIVKASDDVAGLAVGTALQTQVTTLKQALANAAQGNSLLQVADGGLSQINDILQRQKAVAVQASSGSLTDTNRSLLNQEFQNLTAEIDRIASGTNFNGVSLLNGGLGTTTNLFNLDATAVLNTVLGAGITGSAVGTTVAAVSVIEAYKDGSNTANAAGTAARGFAAAGSLDVTDSSGTILTNSSFANVNTSLAGHLTNFKLTNLVLNTSATVSVDIGGVTYSGTYSNAATNFTVSNGTTYLKMGTAAISLASQAAADTAFGVTRQAFSDTQIIRNVNVTGVDFTGTRLQGASGTAASTGIASARLNSNNAVINNFRYVSDTGAANSATIAVDINGTTFQATSVKDAVASATGRIAFQSNDGQTLVIDLASLPAAQAFTNIRTDAAQKKQFIDALNIGFSKAGAGLNFTIGSATTDKIGVSLSSVSTRNLYGGAALDVTTASTAQTASTALDAAITTVVSSRATVGALQSRFNFATAATQSALENQDASRGQLLDTDVSSESTSYATAQVQLQAGISVLAQANQQTQLMLKLLQG